MIDQVQRKHEFRQRSLKRVIKAGPAVKNSATHDQTVKKDRRGNHDKTQAKPIRKIERLTLADPLPLELGIARL